MIDTYLFNIPGAKYSPLKGTNITPPPHGKFRNCTNKT